MPAKIAVLIDAENVDPSYAQQIFSYARSLGEVTIREIYGAGISLNEWADPIFENTIQPKFTLRPNRFKNSSDIALTIGAMEMLFNSRTEKNMVDAVIIASSDSDFSPLAFHLRAAGIDVIGMGEPGRINPMWPKACTEFVPLDHNASLVRRRATPLQTQDASPMPAQVTSPLQSVTEQPVTALPTQEEAQIASTVQTPPEQENAAVPMKEEATPTEAISLTSQKTTTKVAVPKASVADDQKRPEAIKIAPNHRARVVIIRNYINEQLDTNGGRMKSGKLFKALSALPDYRFDQQRSKRKPLDYIDKQYAEWFMLEPGEKGSYWISKREEKDTSTDITTSKPSKETFLDKIPEEHRAQVASILDESNNMFVIYNALTKAFGRKVGKEYYAIIKETSPQPTTPSTITKPSPVSPSASTLVSESKELNSLYSADTKEPASSEAKAQAVSLTPLEQFLTENGLPSKIAIQTASIVNSSTSLRPAYNKLRKTFGNEGTKYYNLVKKYNKDHE